MSKVQTVTTPVVKEPPKHMYRGILTARVVADVFVRATSETAANAAIEAGKGQRMKPRYGKWQVCQEAMAVGRYERSNIPPQAIARSSRLTEQELRKIYLKVLHDIFVLRDGGGYTDEQLQAMADAVREFYDQLSEAICPQECAVRHGL